MTNEFTPDWNENAALTEEIQDLNNYGYASRLATAIHEKHWAATSPEFQLLGTLSGVLTQIDNMTCGLVRKDKNWVGLTVQEVGEIEDKEGNGYIHQKQLQFYADVWAKLKEKNT